MGNMKHLQKSNIYLNVLASQRAVVSKSPLRFLITFLVELVKAESNVRTLSSSLILSVCLIHMKMI